MRENISSVINETFERVILDWSGRIFRVQRKKKNLKIRLVTLLVFAIAASFAFYSVFVKANVFSYHPASCLGNWNNPQYAEGEPTLSPNTSSGRFTKDNSAFFGGGTGQIFCGEFRNDSNAADKIFQKAFLKFSWTLTEGPEPSILEQSEFDQQIINLPASGSVTVIPDQNTSSSSLETSTFPSPQDSPERSITPTIQPTIILTPLPSLTASTSPEPGPTSEITKVEPPEEVQPSTESPILQTSPEASVGIAEPTPEPSLPPPTESPTSFIKNKILSVIFAVDSELSSSTPLSTSQVDSSTLTAPLETNDIASRYIDTSLSQIASLSQSLDDFLEIIYTTDGQNWLPLARVNENNFASLELELPINSWDELENLQISLHGLGTSDLEKQIYLDGMMIEVEYGEPQAIISQEENEAALKQVKKRGTIKIEKEKVFRQRENKNDFRANEEPVFEINTEFPVPASTSTTPLPPLPDSAPVSSSPGVGLWKSNFISFLSWFKKMLKLESARAQQLGDQVSAEVFDFRGQKADIQAIVQSVSGKTIVRIAKERAFKPGRYELRVMIVKNGEAYVTSQDFTWGVLAINVNKSVSLPGEELYLQMGVLNSVGDTICDADLILEVTDPLGIKKIFKTPEKSVEAPNKNFIFRSTECRGNNVTDIPDYFVYYPTTVAGQYAMSLVNLDNQFRISDSFEVKNVAPLEVERISATRINPYQANYVMTMRIKASSDFDGLITETIPKKFQLIAGSGVQTVQSYDSTQKLIWKVNIKKGQTIELKYEYDAPNISPQLYLLGPAIVGREDGSFLFEESRQWQLASDVDTVIFITNDTAPSDSCGANCWTVPADWNNASNSIEVIGGGGGGGDGANTGAGGGGGGGYAKVTNLTLTGNITFSVGASGSGAAASGGRGTNGGHTWFNASSFVNCTDSNVCARAEGGEGGLGASPFTGGLGGATASATGDVGLTFAGGDGGLGHTNDSGGGGGGAAGKAGAGKNGGDAGTSTTSSGGGGGGAGGGSSTAGVSPGSGTDGGAGGTGPTGTAGGAGGTTGAGSAGSNGSGGGGDGGNANGGNGGAGTEWDATHGSGGGGGGGGNGTSSDGGNSGKYGGGGGGAEGQTGATNGDGGGGLIVIKYTPSAAATITLTLDAGGVAALGTLTSGTRKTATTRLKAVQTGASSLTITAGRKRAITNVTLASNAAPLISTNQISDTTGGIDVFSSIANCAAGGGDDPATWGAGVSTGLGFSNWAASSGKDTTCWGTGTTETDALNKYAALQASASASSFINIAASPPATLYTSIGYSLDVSSTQKATTYNGGVVFTATVSP